MASERRLKTQRRTVERLTRELSFELSVLLRMENRSRGEELATPRIRRMGEVYAAALARAGRERWSEDRVTS